MNTGPQPEPPATGVPAPQAPAAPPAPAPPGAPAAQPAAPATPVAAPPALAAPVHAPAAPAATVHAPAVPVIPAQPGPARMPGPFPPVPAGQAPGPYPPVPVGHAVPAGYPPVPGQPWPPHAAPPALPHPAMQQPHAVLVPALPPPAAPPAPGRWRRLARFNTVLAVLLTILVGLVAWQTVRIGELNSALERTESRLGDMRRADADRFDAAESRLGELEQEVGAAFNVEKLAAAVLPSVFKVSAGDYSGTAFAVGPKASDGGTNLFTNFHVVEQVWKSGGRTVTIRRNSDQQQKFEARIVGVNKIRDVAHLHTTAKFEGLAVAKETAKPGQQVIAVGAPLGLGDTVTSGVISAIRETGYDEGPMLQFDAAINPGNSGGPVINARRQVVGITVAGYLNAEGLGLAIPIAEACKIFTVC